MEIALKHEKQFATLGLPYQPTLTQPEILPALARAERAYAAMMAAGPNPAVALRATSAIHVITGLLHPIMRTPNCGPLMVAVCGASCEQPAHAAKAGPKRPCPIQLATAPAMTTYARRWDRKARRLTDTRLSEFVWDRVLDFFEKSPALRNRAKGELQPDPKRLKAYLRKAVVFYYSDALRADPESGVAKQLVARYCANATVVEKDGKEQPFYCSRFGARIASGDERCPTMGLNGKGGKDEHGHMTCFKPLVVSWLSADADAGAEEHLDQAQAEHERQLCGGRVKTPRGE